MTMMKTTAPRSEESTLGQENFSLFPNGYWFRFAFTSGIEIGTVIAFLYTTYFTLHGGLSGIFALAICAAIAWLSLSMAIHILKNTKDIFKRKPVNSFATVLVSSLVFAAIMPVVFVLVLVYELIRALFIGIKNSNQSLVRSVSRHLEEKFSDILTSGCTAG